MESLPGPTPPEPGARPSTRPPYSDFAPPSSWARAALPQDAFAIKPAQVSRRLGLIFITLGVLFLSAAMVFAQFVKIELIVFQLEQGAPSKWLDALIVSVVLLAPSGLALTGAIASATIGRACLRDASRAEERAEVRSVIKDSVHAARERIEARASVDMERPESMDHSPGSLILDLAMIFILSSTFLYSVNWAIGKTEASPPGGATRSSGDDR